MRKSFTGSKHLSAKKWEATTPAWGKQDVVAVNPIRKSSGQNMMERLSRAGRVEIAAQTTTYRLEKLWIRVQGTGSCFCGKLGERHESNTM